MAMQDHFSTQEGIKVGAMTLVVDDDMMPVGTMFSMSK